MEDKIREFGFIQPEILPDEWRLGGVELQGVEVNPSGSWRKWLPEVEMQTDPQFETSNCTAFGSTSQIETLLKYLDETQEKV